MEFLRPDFKNIFNVSPELFLILSTGVMEHWSIGRRGIQDCSAGGQEETAFS
jgi:hypothetical protein